MTQPKKWQIREKRNQICTKKWIEPVRPDWVVFGKSWLHSYLQTKPKYLVTFYAILKDITCLVKTLR